MPKQANDSNIHNKLRHVENAHCKHKLYNITFYIVHIQNGLCITISAYNHRQQTLVEIQNK